MSDSFPKNASRGYDADWEEACESLHYALSYEEDHPAALCLLGNINAECFSNYEIAFECFDKVISNHPEYLEVYYVYARILIWADEIERSQRLIYHALKLKGIDKAQLYCILGQGLEIKRQYRLAKRILDQAILETYNDSYIDFLKDEKRRIQKKIKLFKKTSYSI